MEHTTPSSTRSRLFFTLASKRQLAHWSVHDEAAYTEAATRIAPIDGKWWTICPSLGCDTLRPHDTFKAALLHAIREGVCTVCDARKALMKAKADAKANADPETQERFDTLRSEFVREEQTILELLSDGHDFSYMVYPPTREDVAANSGRWYKNRLNAWSKAIKRRDNHMCQHCGETSAVCAHHKVPLVEDAWLSLDLNNGITLCSDCHTAAHAEQLSNEEESRQRRKDVRALLGD